LKNFFKELFLIFSFKEKVTFFFISILLVVAATFELISIAFFIPFIKISTDFNYFQSSFFFRVFNFFDFLSYQNFVIFLGLVATSLLLISSLLTIITSWCFVKYTHKIGCNLSNRLFLYYLNKKWDFYLFNERNFLFKKIIHDVEIVIDSILIPILFLSSKIVTVIVIFLFLLFLNPQVTFYLFISYLLFYIFFFTIIKRKLTKNSFIISNNQEKKIKILNDSFLGIVDIKLANKEINFYQTFSKANKSYHNNLGDRQVLSLIPKGVLEFISIVSILIIFVIFLKIYNNSFATIIPILAVYALAGFKIIPSLQTIFHNMSIIKGSLWSFNLIKEDLIINKLNHNRYLSDSTVKEILFRDRIFLNNISYTYPSRNISILNNLSLEIKKNSFISIIGPNGSGKSTLVYIILGLINPTKGSMIIDDEQIHLRNDVTSWQKKIGYVSQNIFLFNDTILNNIIFGLSPENVSVDEINKIIKFTNLTEFIDSLPKGLNTSLKDNGIELSGGQKQKLAIARCLIKKSEIIIFDECTSALDLESEKIINELMFNLRGNVTVLNITHKIDSIKNSDMVYYIKNGSVYFYGSYKEVLPKINLNNS
jgi:HlyD family secretion protein